MILAKENYELINSNELLNELKTNVRGKWSDVIRTFLKAEEKILKVQTKNKLEIDNAKVGIGNAIARLELKGKIIVRLYSGNLYIYKGDIL